MITTRPATAQDIQIVHPEMTCSFRAWAVEDDGKLMGLIGVGLTRPAHSLFAWFDEDLRPMLSCPALMRLVLKTRQAMDGMRLPVVAVRDPKERKAPQILKRLGFVFDHLEDGDAIYVRGNR